MENLIKNNIMPKNFIYFQELTSSSFEKFEVSINKINEIEIKNLSNWEKVVITVTEWDNIKNFIDNQFSLLDPNI